MESVIFFIMAGLLTVSAAAVVAFRNPIHSALALVANLLTVAGLFAALEANFLAIVQVIVYAGAIMVLVLFVLMLLNIKVEAWDRRSATLLVLSLVAGTLFVIVAVPLFQGAFEVFPQAAQPLVGSVKAIGKILYTKYIFPFELASILILAAMVGAVMLGKREHSGRSKGEGQ